MRLLRALRARETQITQITHGGGEQRWIPMSPSVSTLPVPSVLPAHQFSPVRRRVLATARANDVDRTFDHAVSSGASTADG